MRWQLYRTYAFFCRVLHSAYRYFKTMLKEKFQATLLNSVQKCTYLIAALVMQHTSGIILPVSKLLQKKELDIFAVTELIDSVLDILRQNRSNCENVFHTIFDQAKNECEKYDAPLLIPRRYKSQIFRDNYPSDDPEHFFGKPYLYRI